MKKIEAVFDSNVLNTSRVRPDLRSLIKLLINW